MLLSSSCFSRSSPSRVSTGSSWLFITSVRLFPSALRSHASSLTFAPPPVLFKLKSDLTQEQRDTFLPICQEGLAKVPYGTSDAMGPPIYDARVSSELKAKSRAMITLRRS